jgi:hypothetical protein
VEETSKTIKKSPKRIAIITVALVILAISSIAFWICYQAMKAESHARYMGIMKSSAQNVSRTIRGVEMNAKNVFEEVAEHLDSAEDVIKALESKAYFNLDVKGYFAAFEPNYFPEKGTWFEPYIYQPDARGFEYRQVGSARHNYMKSSWYLKAKATRATFWSDPYYYYDGTSMSGHYCTFVKPLYSEGGKLICVCGADMTFEWMEQELEWQDETSRRNALLNKYHPNTVFDYYTILLDKDGTCVAHPQNKVVSITDKDIIKDLADKKSGVANMDIDGVPCTLFYGPIDFVDWTLAIVVPKQDILRPMLPIAIVLSLAGVIGFLVVWLALRRIQTTTEDKEVKTDEKVD